MYNKFLCYLLSNDPEKTITKSGILVRKMINPIIRFVARFMVKSKLHVVRRAQIPKQPVIFAATHSYKEDIEDTIITANRQAFILIGSLSQIFRSFDGITAWAAGTILVDRMDKQSRLASKEKMIRALNLGASILVYPEGTWNKSPNLMMNKLFPGIYDVAKATGALVVPVATHRDGNRAYSILDEAFNITEYDRKNGMGILRDKLATLRWELMEKYSAASRADFPSGTDAEIYWSEYIDGLMAEVKYYDYDVELHTKYVDPNITKPADAFAHLKRLIPSRENAFLLNQRYGGYYES